jgi:rare lipoprotein A
MDRGQVARMSRLTAALLGSAALTACATPQYSIQTPVSPTPQAKASPRPGTHFKTGDPYQVAGIWYVPHDQPNYDETGIASWYGDAFHMKATANGEIFDMNQFSAAHTTLPLPSMVEVTNLDNGRKLTVRVNDRGPFVGRRVIDLSHAAARELGYDRQGTAHVRVRYVGPAPLAGPEAGMRYARAASSVHSARPADEDIFYETPPAAPKPLVARPAPVSVSTLTPLAPVRRGLQVEVASAGQAYRIQAGAFGDQDNARRAASQLAAEGIATVEPFERRGVTVYRVMLPGPTDEAEAYALRDKVALVGFTDARVVRPF